ncbi:MULTISPECIES: thermonuclease family protein [Methanothermobacter]|uniref:Thermonuclease family protein n=1 Tax=Methanothermobacter wolfeii TaxID=145261 RepID=A0A9E7RUQ1_METWO|nr:MULTISPECIES: thermonuclease family protein [Methanothermobacter]MDI6701548.1 thermonuclease family protein [Methanothermobacter wolfeii]UXH32544.1 thermonuclease family protein [Methanothermobacter wolfeii]
MKRYILVVLLAVMVAGCVSDESEFDYTGTGNDTPSIENVPDNQSSSINSTDNSTDTSGVKYDASGYCYHVVDGDTIDVEGVGRIRFVGVNTPERGQSGYREAKDFVKSSCLGRTVQLDIDDARRHDKYGRVLAVVYVDGVNLNRELLRRGYAEVMYIPPSEFNPYEWT